MIDTYVEYRIYIFISDYTYKTLIIKLYQGISLLVVLTVSVINDNANVCDLYKCLSVWVIFENLSFVSKYRY